MNLAINLTEQELVEIRQWTRMSDAADAVSLAAREYLRSRRASELTTMAGELEYDETAWRDLDEAELTQDKFSIEVGKDSDG